VIRAQVQQQGYEIERMCLLAGVSRAGYYRHWQASKPREADAALRDEIQKLSLAQRKNGYRHNGYRVITVLLQRAGWQVNHKRVARIRREDNLLCVSGRTFRPPITDSRHGWRVWPNLARHMVPMAVNQLWVADITYIRMREEFVYLAVVIDAFSRRVIGGRWRSICGPNWQCRPWRWRLPIVWWKRAHWCTTPIKACNMPAATTSAGCNRRAFSLR
jgi:hypothetical protein